MIGELNADPIYSVQPQTSNHRNGLLQPNGSMVHSAISDCQSNSVCKRSSKTPNPKMEQTLSRCSMRREGYPYTGNRDPPPCGPLAKQATSRPTRTWPVPKCRSVALRLRTRRSHRPSPERPRIAHASYQGPLSHSGQDLGPSRPGRCNTSPHQPSCLW